MKQYINLIIILFYLCPVCCLAQAGNHSGKDSVSVAEKFVLQADTVRIDSLTNAKTLFEKEKFKPNATKATIYAVIFPGLGQIYNRKYWKLPLVYGSFIGCVYAITWNGNQYNGYRKAYLDFLNYLNDKPNSNTWNAYIAAGNPFILPLNKPNDNSWDAYRYGTYLRQDPSTWTSSMENTFSSNLKSARDYYRRYRDLSYIITVGVYAIWIIDAYVDAQLFDFDISPDLSMHIEPVLFDRTAVNTRSIGMQLSFAF